MCTRSQQKIKSRGALWIHHMAQGSVSSIRRCGKSVANENGGMNERTKGGEETGHACCVIAILRAILTASPGERGCKRPDIWRRLVCIRSIFPVVTEQLRMGGGGGRGRSNATLPKLGLCPPKDEYGGRYVSELSNNHRSDNMWDNLSQQQVAD